MKCLYCNEEMVYKPNISGYGGRGIDYNGLVVDYSEYVNIIGNHKIKRSKFLEISPKYYVCPKCGLILQKIPQKDIDDVINSEV